MDVLFVGGGVSGVGVRRDGPSGQSVERRRRPRYTVSLGAASVGGNGAGGTKAMQDDVLPTIKDFNRKISYHGRRREFDAARKVKGMIEAAEALDTGIRRNVYTFNAWLDACVRCGRMELTEDAMREMMSIGVSPNIVSFNTMLKGYATGAKKDLEKALALLVEMRKFGVEPDILSYNTMFNACAMSKDMRKAKELFAEMLRKNVKPDDFTITTLAKGWMNVRDVEELDKLLLLKLKMESFEWSSRKRSSTAYYTIADGYIRCGRPRKAVALIKALLPDHREEEDSTVFHLLHNLDIDVEVNTFNVLLKALRESGASSATAQTVLKEMEKYKIVPDNITYLALVDLLCSNGDMELAEKTIASLRETKIPLTPGVFNALIKGYTRWNRPNLEKIFEIYDAMKAREDGYCSPDHITSSCVVDALARTGDVEKALEVLQAAEGAEDFHEKPRRETFNAVIKAYRTSLMLSLAEGHPDEIEEEKEYLEQQIAEKQLDRYFLSARRILNRMSGYHDERMRPDVVTYNTLIDICAELGNIQSAEKLFEEMIEHNIQPDVRTFNTLIKTGNRARSGVMAAFKWTKKMASFDVVADQYTYAGLLSASAESKDVAGALKYFQKTLHSKQNELTKNREEGEPAPQLSVHPSAYISLMKAFSNLGLAGSKMIFTLREELEARGYEMGVSGYTAIANCYAQQGNYEAVNLTFDEMIRKTTNIPDSLNRRQQSIRIKAYCRGNRLEDAVNLFFSESSPDVAMYNTILSFCCEAKDMDNVVRILRQMEAAGIKPDARTGASVKDMMQHMAKILKGFDQRFSSMMQQALQEKTDSSPPKVDP